jgi:bacterioferritin-associated ferredoxin
MSDGKPANRVACSELPFRVIEDCQRMIVCSCNRISDAEIDRTIDELMVDDPLRVVTPGEVYRALGKRPRCGTCLSLAAQLAHKRSACLRGCHQCTCKHSHTNRAQDLVSERALVKSGMFTA